MNNETNLTWREQEISIKGKNTEQLTFIDTKPNHFVVKNHGQSTVYIGLTYTPKTNYYDLKVEPGASAVIAKVVGCGFIWLYNDGTESAIVQVTSFYNKEINVNFLAAGGVTAAEMKEVIGGTATETIIKSFGAALPAGSNHIGEVSLQTPTGGLPVAMETSCGDPVFVKVCGNSTSTPFYVSDGTAQTTLAAVSNKLDALADMLTELETIATNTAGGGSGGSTGGGAESYAYAVSEEITTGTSYTKTLAAASKKLSFLTNDSDTAFSVVFTLSGGGSITLVVKAGETLSDIPISVTALSITGSATLAARYLLLSDTEMGAA